MKLSPSSRPLKQRRHQRTTRSDDSGPAGRWRPRVACKRAQTREKKEVSTGWRRAVVAWEIPRAAIHWDGPTFWLAAPKFPLDVERLAL